MRGMCSIHLTVHNDPKTGEKMSCHQFELRCSSEPDVRWQGVLVISIIALLIAWIMSGCVVCYAPEARTFALYSHIQNASNMVVNQDIPLTALRASASASLGSGNTITGIKAK
jgi:hypothetical protein